MYIFYYFLAIFGNILLTSLNLSFILYKKQKSNYLAGLVSIYGIAGLFYIKKLLWIFYDLF